MMEDTIHNPTLTGASSGEEALGSTADTPAQRSDPLIPIPASKWREAQELKRELAQIKNERRATTLPTEPKASLTPEADAALDHIADRTAGKFRNELLDVRDELDDLALERGLARVMEDETTSPYRADMMHELKELRRSNPKARMSDLLEQAEERAIVKTFRSGKLTQAMTDEAHDQLQTKTRLSSRPTSASTPTRGKEEVSLEEMTPEQLAASGKLNEYFAQTQGRSPRR